MSTLSAETIKRLRQAVQAKAQAEQVIAEISAQLPGRNKTHAVRRALGLCPECGREKPVDKFYCEDCGDLHTTYQVKRNQRRKRA